MARSHPERLGGRQLCQQHHHKVTRTRLTRLGTPAPATLNLPAGTLLIAESESIDWLGNVTRESTYQHTDSARSWVITESPTSTQPAIREMLAGYPLMDVSYSNVTNSYAYDALARPVTLTDGRGNTTLTVYDAVGQIAYTEDGAANRITYAYDMLGQRIATTDPLGNTTHSAYDAAGNVISQWGATYPVLYGYDTQGRMISMSTTRDSTNWDTTQWLYDNVTGLLTNKLYATGHGTSYSYFPNHKLATRTWARGVTTDYAYDDLGQLTTIHYSDTTPDVSFVYDRLGYLTAVTDASGTHTISHTVDGQTLCNTVTFIGGSYSLAELYDQYGRSAGYALSNTVGSVSSQLCRMDTAYNELGQIIDVGTSGLSGKFEYSYLAGSELVSSLEMPNGVTRTTSYATNFDMPVSITHSNTLNAVLAERTFGYGSGKQLSNRTQYRQGDGASRSYNFDYNERREVTNAVIGSDSYRFDFDSIGNRLSVSEGSATTGYLSNPLNQYTAITEGLSAFEPLYDLDGNQTLIRTSTGIWHVSYNAENRPICFSNESAVVEMDYDYQGRRFEYKETVNETATRHERYLYRNYLQVAALDLLNSTSIIHTIVWDPTEPVATRPLLLQTPSGWFTYSLDQVKNVTELFDSNGATAATYDYSPFGKVIASSGSAVSLNPLTFSSEISDTMLGLIYYNFRHYNPLDGRWLCPDPIEERGGLNLYCILKNNLIEKADYLGLKEYKVPSCTYEVLVGHGFSSRTIQKYGGLLPANIRRKSQVPSDIRLGENSAATVVACNDIWYILIRDEDRWVLPDGGISGFERASTETLLLYTSTRMQQAYDAAINAATKARRSDDCTCKNGITVKMTCFFTLIDLYFGTTGDVRQKCKLKTIIR